MSKRTNAVSISTVGIDTGKNTLVAFWHVTDLAQCLTLVRDVLGFATPAEQFNACVASTA